MQPKQIHLRFSQRLLLPESGLLQAFPIFWPLFSSSSRYSFLSMGSGNTASYLKAPPALLSGLLTKTYKKLKNDQV